MTDTLQASPKAIRIAAEINRKRQDALARVAKAIEDDFRRQEREQRIAPTPERLRKGDITNKSDRDGPRAAVAPDIVHQVKDPLDNVRKHLSEDEIAVIARFVINCEHAQRTKAITANYEGSSGGAYGPRHGGLPDKSRQAATIAEWMLRQMHHEFQSVAEFVVYATQRDRKGNPLTSRDFMGNKFPDMGDKARRDGGYIALCRSLAWRLQELERDLHASERGETQRGQNHVRQIVRERAGA